MLHKEKYTTAARNKYNLCLTQVKRRWGKQKTQDKQEEKTRVGEEWTRKYCLRGQHEEERKVCSNLDLEQRKRKVLEKKETGEA